MATTIPTIKITPVEAQGGFLITCSRCPKVRVIRDSRRFADRYAVQHLAGHGTPALEDQEAA